MKTLWPSLRTGDCWVRNKRVLLRVFGVERCIVEIGRATLLLRPIVFEAWLGWMETVKFESGDCISRRRHATGRSNRVEEVFENCWAGRLEGGCGWAEKSTAKLLLMVREVDVIRLQKILNVETSDLPIYYRRIQTIQNSHHMHFPTNTFYQ